MTTCKTFTFVIREFRVFTTLNIILALVTGLYGGGWLYEQIKKWRQSNPQYIQNISGSVNDPGNVPANPAPQQPAPIQFNNQAHNPQVVNGVLMLVSCVIMLFASLVVMQILPEMSNEKLDKFRPLVGPTFVQESMVFCPVHKLCI